MPAPNDRYSFLEEPMRLAFYFDNAISTDRLRQTMEAVAAELRAEPISLVEVHRQALEDKNTMTNAYEALWEAPGVVYTAEARCGSICSPWDGWGYDIRFVLVVEAPEATIRLELSDAVYGPPLHPKEGLFRLEGADHALFDRVHQVLARYLESDRTMADYPAVLNIEAALEAGHPAFARALFEHARQRGPVNSFWWERLKKLEARL